MRRTWAIVATVANLIVPGVGTVMIGKWRFGIIQLGVFAGIWVLTLLSLGFLHPILFPIGMANRLAALGVGGWAIVTAKTERERLT